MAQARCRADPDKLAELAEKGYTIRQAAEHLGLKYSYVWGKATQYDIPFRRGYAHVENPRKKMFEKLAGEVSSVTEAADRLGVTHSAILYWEQKYGVRFPRGKRKPREIPASLMVRLANEYNLSELQTITGKSTKVIRKELKKLGLEARNTARFDADYQEYLQLRWGDMLTRKELRDRYGANARTLIAYEERMGIPPHPQKLALELAGLRTRIRSRTNGWGRQSLERKAEKLKDEMRAHAGVSIDVDGTVRVAACI